MDWGPVSNLHNDSKKKEALRQKCCNLGIKLTGNQTHKHVWAAIPEVTWTIMPPGPEEKELTEKILKRHKRNDRKDKSSPTANPTSSYSIHREVLHFMTSNNCTLKQNIPHSPFISPQTALCSEETKHENILPTFILPWTFHHFVKNVTQIHMLPIWTSNTWHERGFVEGPYIYHLDPFFFFFFWACAGFCCRGPADAVWGDAVDAGAGEAADAEDDGRGDEGSLLPPGDGLLASLHNKEKEHSAVTVERKHKPTNKGMNLIWQVSHSCPK